MRAAIIGSSNLGLNGIAERNVIQMAEIINGQGYDVTIFTPPGNNKNINTNGEFTVNTNAFKMDLFARKTFINLSGGRTAELIGLFSFDLIYKELTNYDLYYFASPSILFAKMSKYFYTNNMHPKIILGNQGTYFEYLNRKFMEKPLINILNRLIFGHLNRIDLKIQVQNKFQRDFYRKLGVPDGNLIKMPQYNLQYDKYYTNPGKKFSVICNYGISSFMRNRLLMKTVRRYNNITFRFISYRKKPGRCLKKLSVYGNVQLFEHPDNNLKFRLLASSDVMINLSRYEPLNSSYLEAPLSGLPLLSTNIYSAPEMPESISGTIEFSLNTRPEIFNNFIEKYKNMKENNSVFYAFLRDGIRRKSLNYFSSEMVNTFSRNLLFEDQISKDKISIVTASLNEAGNIRTWLEQIYRTLELYNIKNIDEIVIVDDGSTDGTVEIIEEYKKVNTRIAINLVKRHKKMGTLDAQIAGAKIARNPYIIVMDCDLQHPVEYIKDFVEKFNQGYSVVIGSRYIIGSKNNWEYKREVISRIATGMAHSMFPFTARIKDPLSGYFMCRRNMLASLKPYKSMYKPLLCLLIFNNKNRNIREIPIEMRGRKSGESKIVNNYSKTVVLYSHELLTYYKEYNKIKFKSD